MFSAMIAVSSEYLMLKVSSPILSSFSPSKASLNIITALNFVWLHFE